MATLGSSEIRKGKIILHKGAPTLVLDHHLHKFGRGGSQNKTKVKNLLTGAITQVTFSGNEKAEEVEIENRNIQYLYADGSDAFFMDPNSFEQMQVGLDMIDGGENFLKEGEEYQGVFYEGSVISLLLPKKIALKVTSAPPGEKGDSANNPQKEITLETGFKINAPLFVKQGEVVFVNTESGEYGGREN